MMRDVCLARLTPVGPGFMQGRESERLMAVRQPIEWPFLACRSGGRTAMWL